jgi:hypothetical protein
MNNLADVALDYFWFLNFSTEEEADIQLTSDRLGELAHQIETELSAAEKDALKAAASRRLVSWLMEPDEHGYTPRKLLTAEQKSFLEDIAEGRFSGRDPDDADTN